MEKNNKQVKKRIDYIDFYKGIGIILMIMGHIGYGKIFNKFIHAFHMPMFFIITGFLFYNSYSKKFKEFLKTKSKQLLIPYFIFGFLHLLIFCLLNINNTQEIIHKTQSLLFINTNNMPITGALWFLTALFFAEIIYFLISKINNRIKPLVIILLTAIGVTIPFVVRLPFAIDVSLASQAFLYAGEIISKNKERIFKTNPIYITFLSIVLIVLIFVNGYVNLRLGEYSIIPLTYFNAIVASIIILYIANFACKLKNKLLNVIINAVKNIGMNSITYLVLNEIMVISLIDLLIAVHIPIIIAKLICLPVVLIILYLTNKLLNTKYLKLSIGKYNKTGGNYE